MLFDFSLPRNTFSSTSALAQFQRPLQKNSSWEDNQLPAIAKLLPSPTANFYILYTTTISSYALLQFTKLKKSFQSSWHCRHRVLNWFGAMAKELKSFRALDRGREIKRSNSCVWWRSNSNSPLVRFVVLKTQLCSDKTRRRRGYLRKNSLFSLLIDVEPLFAAGVPRTCV